MIVEFALTGTMPSTMDIRLQLGNGSGPSQIYLFSRYGWFEGSDTSQNPVRDFEIPKFLARFRISF